LDIYTVDWLFKNNILLAEEVSQCPLASSRRDIVVDRTGVRPLATCSIMMRRLVTFSHDTIKLFRIVRSSKWENILLTECWEEPEYNNNMHENCGVA
jgi:hypothetical protein